MVGLISFISFCMYNYSKTSEILEDKYHTYKNDIINETLQEKNVDEYIVENSSLKNNNYI